MILITTAGTAGSEAARLLAARGEPARVLARDPEKAVALARTGLEVAEGDLGVPAAIDAASARRRRHPRCRPDRRSRQP